MIVEKAGEEVACQAIERAIDCGAPGLGLLFSITRHTMKAMMADEAASSEHGSNCRCSKCSDE